MIWLAEYIFNNFQCDYIVSKISEKYPFILKYLIKKPINPEKIEFRKWGEVGYYTFIIPEEFEEQFLEIIKENEKRLNDLKNWTHIKINCYDSLSQIRWKGLI